MSCIQPKQVANAIYYFRENTKEFIPVQNDIQVQKLLVLPLFIYVYTHK